MQPFPFSLKFKGVAVLSFNEVYQVYYNLQLQF
jgi:hypothetical protein